MAPDVWPLRPRSMEHRPHPIQNNSGLPKVLRPPIVVAFSAVLFTSVALLAVDQFLDAKALVFVYPLHRARRWRTECLIQVDRLDNRSPDVSHRR
jgi:hypothetical protein